MFVCISSNHLSQKSQNMEGSSSNGDDNYAPHLINDFGLHDFINDANFVQFIDLIRGERSDPHHDHPAFVNDFNHDELMINNINGSNFVDYNSLHFGPTLGAQPILFDDFNTSVAAMSDPNSLLSSLGPSIDHHVDMNGGEEDDDEEEENDGDDSATTTTTNTTTPGSKKQKVDRSRTLVSERRRRGRMKDKLYALRSLVPNITKMDKASIVGDAVLYVQELQMQAKKLRVDISGLESSITQGGDKHQGSTPKPKKVQAASHNFFPICRKIVQMDMYQVEERGYYVRLVCNKGEGVAASLYKALESLTSFSVRSSNLATLSDTFVLTLTINAKEFGENVNLPNLKLWMSGALLNQGFELKTSP